MEDYHEEVESEDSSECSFQSDRGINRRAYQRPGESDTMSESSDSDSGSSDDGPIDGEDDELVDYNELYGQSRLQEMTTLFDSMMELRRAGRGPHLDTTGDTPSLRRSQTTPAGTYTAAKINS